MATIMSLDDRIYQDLSDLYNHNEMSGANNLKGTIKNSKNDLDFSSRLLPTHFTGFRDAKTVFVMLNPGYYIRNNTTGSDQEELERKDCVERTKGFCSCSLSSFIKCYKCKSINYGNLDFDRLDNFDLKQAAFLKPWLGSGIEIPDLFLCNNELRKVAKRNVLTQKLQLELVPYCSRTFTDFVPCKISSFYPYLETILDELFRAERSYVIFGSALFEKLFQAYNVIGTFDLSCPNEKIQLTPKLGGQCKFITIKYNRKSINALIAHTFPSQALPNAYNIMQKYGDFCYEVFMSHL